MVASNLTPDDEALLRRWWSRNRPRGRLTLQSHAGDGDFDGACLEITLKSPLPKWLSDTAGPPTRPAAA